jgi:2'-5' RNA ligase
VRLFAAAVPDPAALADLDCALGKVRELPGSPRWTDSQIWHLTLAFYGEVADTKLDRLTQALDAAASGHGSVHVRLSGIGTFPPRGAPQVLWVGVSGADGAVDRLTGLARAAARAGRSAGLPVERRRYRPHVTLGRWRRGDRPSRDLVAALADYTGPEFAVNELVLMRSYLGPAPRYEPVARWPLR